MDAWQRFVSSLHINAITLFGLFAVTAMLVSYALEETARVFILMFAMSCFMGSAYGFLQGAWPFGVVEGIWGFVALRKWIRHSPTAESRG